MKVASCLHDNRINAHNVLIEISIGDYEAMVKPVLDKNEFQRKRVRSSKTVYSLLRSDLTKQCVIPPVVLALTSSVGDFDINDTDGFEAFLGVNQEHLVILDGLQRTHTILDLVQELRASSDEQTLRSVLGTKIRAEIYVGINRIGILYRMLTLNTGQTPMSLRQQIEILYLDYLDENISGVELIREVDGRAVTRPEQYIFKDMVEGFNSYLDRDELPIDKSDILENISSLEKLSKENQEADIFKGYVEAFSSLVCRFDELLGGLVLSEDYIEKNSSPFGESVQKIFKKPQAMSGFGAAMGKLIDAGVVGGFDSVKAEISQIEINDGSAFLEEINNSLDWLKNNTKKIGNAQRTFFTYFFRDLLNRESDAFRCPVDAAKSGLRKYQAQNM
ncbi:MAG TPA: hypothetical protein DF427_07610 [Moraxellaceae bacterium]|nr:hypothetical protein [Moraxellaceae bacterium]